MFSLLRMLVIGLIVGALARFLYPGPQNIGLLMTSVLGIVGSFVGGLLANLTGIVSGEAKLQPAGIIMSVIGAIAVIYISHNLFQVV